MSNDRKYLLSSKSVGEIYIWAPSDYQAAVETLTYCGIWSNPIFLIDDRDNLVLHLYPDMVSEPYYILTSKRGKTPLPQLSRQSEYLKVMDTLSAVAMLEQAQTPYGYGWRDMALIGTSASGHERRILRFGNPDQVKSG